MYFNFYVPFLNNKKAIEKYIELNKYMQKGKIAGVYMKIPLDFFPDGSIENVKLLRDNGIPVILDLDFCVKLDNKWICVYFDKFKSLVEKWISLGFNEISLTDTMLAKFLMEQYPQIKVHGSYKQNLSTMKQVSNLIHELNNMASISPSLKSNHNLKFLQHLHSFIPDKIQVVVNSGCRNMCYRSVLHSRWYDAKTLENSFGYSAGRWTGFYSCFEEYRKEFWLNFIMSDLIYPWQLEDLYCYTGIKDFRLLPPKEEHLFNVDEILNFILCYLYVFEDYEANKNLPFHCFNNYLIDKIESTAITLDEIRKYIPALAFYTHDKGNCADNCIVHCNRCKEIANKLNQKYLMSR